MDESRCDTKAGGRRTGWAPCGIAPLHTAWADREQRHQTLPAYTPDAVIYNQIFQGLINRDVFEGFIRSCYRYVGDGLNRIPFL